jgi:hypothetical protein
LAEALLTELDFAGSAVVVFAESEEFAAPLSAEPSALVSLLLVSPADSPLPFERA